MGESRSDQYGNQLARPELRLVVIGRLKKMDLLGYLLLRNAPSTPSPRTIAATIRAAIRLRS